MPLLQASLECRYRRVSARVMNGTLVGHVTIPTGRIVTTGAVARW